MERIRAEDNCEDMFVRVRKDGEEEVGVPGTDIGYGRQWYRSDRMGLTDRIVGQCV